MPAINLRSLRGAVTHPLARMLPLFKWQRQTYALGEAHPPLENMADMGPQWIVFDLVLDALSTLQVRTTVQAGFVLLGVTAGSSPAEAGGVLPFRAQLYDLPRKRRLADRGVQSALLGGGTTGGFMLREPYPLDLPNHQILVVAQNMAQVQNAVQLVLYGVAKRIDQK